jgi:hypothetical protein
MTKFKTCLMASVSMLMLLTNCNAQRKDKKYSDAQLFSQASGSPMSVDCAPSNIAFGDFNNDTKTDLVVACENSRQISIFEGNGNGQFHILNGSPISLQVVPHELAVADLNSDNKLDIAFTNHDNYGVNILVGDGKGGFTLSSNSPVNMRNGSHPHTHGLAVEDFNKDGNPDLVTVNNDDNDIALALGDGRGGFTIANNSPFSVDQSPYPISVGDVNHDSNPDIVVTSTRQRGQSGKSLTLLSGDGFGGFKRSQLPLRTVNPGYVAIGDINNDQRVDIATTHLESNELTILLGDGSGHFTETTASPYNLGHSSWQVGIKDVNHDGRPDILAAAGTSIRIMLGDGQGGFTQAPGSPYETAGGTWRFAIGDINGDNKPDIATCNQDKKSVTVLLGTH